MSTLDVRLKERFAMTTALAKIARLRRALMRVAFVHVIDLKDSPAHHYWRCLLCDGDSDRIGLAGRGNKRCVRHRTTCVLHKDNQ